MTGRREHRLMGACTGSPLQLSLLCGFELRKDSVRIALPLGMQRLLALLALRERSLHRIHIAATLWLDVCEDRAGANLRTAIWRLRSLDRNLISASPTHVALGESVSVDVRGAMEHARRLLDDPEGYDCAELSAAEFSSDLLPDWYDDWLLLEQEQFRQVRLHALEALCARLTAAGRFAAAVEAGVAAVAGEPLRESAQRVLIGAYIAEGNTTEALRQYGLYTRMLRAELGLEPSEPLMDLLSALPARVLDRAACNGRSDAAVTAA